MRSTESSSPPTGSSQSPEAALHQIFLNAASLFLAYLLPRLCTFGALVVAARALGTSEFGAYGTAAAFAVIMSILATLGMMPFLIRQIARDPSRAAQAIRSAHLVKTGANAVMLAALFVAAQWILGYSPKVVGAALLLGGSYAVGAYVENLAAYFQAVERMHVWMKASAIFGFVSGLLGLLLVVTTSSLVLFCAAPMIGQSAAFVWLIRQAPPEVRLGSGAGIADVVELLRSLAPFGAAFVALTFYYKVDVLLLAWWRPSHDVGIYTASYKFVDIMQALALVAVGSVYPRLARAAARETGESRSASSRLTELALIATVPIGALLWLGRSPVIHSLYGPAYSDSVGVLALLAPVIPALSVNMLAGYVLGAAGRMYHVAALYSAGAILNVGLNAALIPTHGAVGAAAAMLASETVLALSFLLVLRFIVGTSPGQRALLISGVAAVACVMTGLLSDQVGSVDAAILYTLIIALAYWRFKVLTAEEWLALRRFARAPSRNLSLLYRPRQ